MKKCQPTERRQRSSVVNDLTSTHLEQNNEPTYTKYSNCIEVTLMIQITTKVLLELWQQLVHCDEINVLIKNC